MRALNRWVAVFLLFMGLLVLGGCSALPARKSAYAPGTILLLPARDAVQDGKEHPAGVGSGQALTELLQKQLARSRYSVVLTDNPAFTSRVVATRDEALDEARRLKADYCLQLGLGEFLDAFPLTFRNDYLELRQGTMYRVDTGQVVWELTGNRFVEKGNIGSYRSLLNGLAARVAASITR